MSRIRAMSDPWYAVARSSMTLAGQSLMQGIYAATRRSPALREIVWLGSGWRPGSTEHATGRAGDIMVSRAVGVSPTAAEKQAGDLLADWLAYHSPEIGIRHIIWDNKIWRTRYKNWGVLPGNRSTISDRHEDHLHILLDTFSKGWHPDLDHLVIGKESVMPVTSQEIVEGVLNSPFTANGETLPLKDHLAKLFVYNYAQSVAVGDEINRDKKNHSEMMGKLNTILDKVSGMETKND